MSDAATPSRLLLRLFLPFGLGYFVSYVFRTVNAVIAPDLVTDLGLSPASLGLLTSAYFLTFAAFQLPLGILLDRYGSRRVESVLLLFAAAGALLFSLADSLSMLLLGRALIGLGVSACLMAAFKSFSAWLPADRLPFANGVQMVSGGLGALTATTPVQMALQITDWRGVFLLLAGLGLLAAIAVFLLVPEQPLAGEKESFRQQLDGLKIVLSSRTFWRIAPWAFTSQAAYLSIQGLWSGPWLRDVALYGREQVADVLFIIALAMIAGYFAFGSLAGKLSKYGVAPGTVAAGGMAVFLLVQLLLVVAPQYAALLWPGFGFFGTACILPYAVLAQSFPKSLTGRSNTSLNLLVFVAAFAAQWLIGAIIGLWPLSESGGYQPAGYRSAFLLLIACQLLTAGWYGYAGLKKKSGQPGA
ncbi:Predicted arabinose efflux permease, MFS family [Malonomonas rubra DSM 5091]|uniref:Predicted arabinose efflux permease, MFS family n=1 Tax=Malonomonas rubra DSM 5091 TaxID=1122189 RepID=A0A1M6E535_MALRU|nr:MFS transporter [Malonomonas rubra]SHI80607.1 Predicted arabinose efflux permease, MFS family [Malonomonas rubra DSM 5091]